MEARKNWKGGLREEMGNRVRHGSLGCIDELWKRKREDTEAEGEENFNRSKKTIRTPEGEKKEGRKDGQSGEVREEEKWRRWKEEIEESMKEIMRGGIKEWKEEMGRWKEEMKGEWEKISKDLREGRKEREELKEQVKVIEKRIEDLERREISGGERGELEANVEKKESRTGR